MGGRSKKRGRHDLPNCPAQQGFPPSQEIMSSNFSEFRVKGVGRDLRTDFLSVMVVRFLREF